MSDNLGSGASYRYEVRMLASPESTTPDIVRPTKMDVGTGVGTGVGTWVCCWWGVIRG
jgi:hypothetical protein